MEEQKMQEVADKQIKELKEQGYKSIYERDRDREYKQALKDYDRHLSCPYG